MTVSLFLYALVVVALLIAELREDLRAQFFFKPLAALGFVILALQFGALETTYGKYILAGLIACAVGDIFLLSRKSEKLFKVGMVAFALGHIAYIAGFHEHHYPYFNLAVFRYVIIALIVTVAISFFIWLRPNLDKADVSFVFIYTAIIVVMTSASISRLNVEAQILVPFAAFMFAISDMFVARDRFVTPDSKNFLAITPLYFGAQALFALSTAI